MVDEIEHVVGETSRRQKNSVSLGYVTGVNYTANTITVTLDTGQENVQCRWLAKRWGTGSAIDSEWWAPEIKECVLILEVAGIEKIEYVIIGSMPEIGKGTAFDKERYAIDTSKPSKESKDGKIKSIDIYKKAETRHQITYSDGTTWSYDKGKKQHKIELKMKDDDKKENISLTIDATKKTINLTTGKKVKLDIIAEKEGSESIEIVRDKDKMIMNKGGFELDCEKDIKITSKANVTIKGKAIMLDAGSQVDIQKAQVTVKSKAINLKAKSVDAAP